MKMMFGLCEAEAADTALVALCAAPHRKLKLRAIPAKITPRRLLEGVPITFMVILV